MNERVEAALHERLVELFGAGTRLTRAALLGGGASMEAWAIDVETPGGSLAVLVRRAAGGRIYREALPLANEFRVLQAAFAAGVKVPRPYGYFADLAGRDAFAMERLQGETVGRRIVQKPELAGVRAALPEQMAEQLARIHKIDAGPLAFLPGATDDSPLRHSLDALETQLDEAFEPHPAIELGLLRLRRDLPRDGARVVCHGDFRVGNLMVAQTGLAGVLDWEFAHVGDPREDLAWPMVRAWRFGNDALALGGVAQPEPFLERYGDLTGRRFSPAELRVFELLGNVRWAIGALTQARRHLAREERSVELAILGRLASEVEHEVLSLL